MEIKVHRANIRNDMLIIFANPCILDECITLDVIFINRRGEEEAGRGSGLLRDLFSLFWKDVYQSLMVGEIERVPSIRHDFQRPEWEAIGRILMKGFSSCQYFPLMLSKTFFITCLYGESASCLDGQVDPLDEELCDFLSTFDCKKVVNATNIKGILVELAHKELIQKPQYVAECWKSVIPWLCECFPKKEKLDNLYEKLCPTVSRVISCFEADETNEAERDAMKHLKRFVRGLDTAKLGKFLQFVTGSDIMLCDHIYVSFTRLDGLQRRPVAHTCTFTLEIPCTYQSFPEFREEFNSILEANTWEMDIV
ncbi:uncharacterized protein LOC122954470 [Acropora millepora]|uniref:uncharacterized protein LOC122954470 n=1 Tax=Acropora millepora TaxID=45264 RepID=UPI001CF524CA|nr:uncharacterized protein LOC122954470 [Acropora millepora]